MMVENGDIYPGEEKIMIGGSYLKGHHWKRNEACSVWAAELEIILTIR